MLFKIVLFIIGIILCALSLTFMTLYLNMINLGYSLKEFVNFIISRWECYFLPLGILLIILSLTKRRKIK